MRSRISDIIWVGILALMSSGCFVSGTNRMRTVTNASKEASQLEGVIQGALAFGGTSSAFLDKNSVDAMVYRGVPDIRACYEQETKCNKRNPPTGKIVVRFTITREGDIKNVGIESSTMNSQEMEACLIRVFQGFEYYNPMRAEFVLSYPFIFQSS